MSDATTVEDDGFNPEDYEDPDPRLPRGYLALDVFNICTRFVNKDFTLEEGKFMTPYMISKIIQEENNGRKKPPSTGAITSVFHRWEQWDFVVCRKNPYAFTAFTAKGERLGLTGITKERAELNKQERARSARPRD